MLRRCLRAFKNVKFLTITPRHGAGPLIFSLLLDWRRHSSDRIAAAVATNYESLPSSLRPFEQTSLSVCRPKCLPRLY